MGFQPLSPSGVLQFTGKMNTPVHFDGQAALDTEKIDDKFPDFVLPPEF